MNKPRLHQVIDYGGDTLDTMTEYGLRRYYHACWNEAQSYHWTAPEYKKLTQKAMAARKKLHEKMGSKAAQFLSFDQPGINDFQAMMRRIHMAAINGDKQTILNNTQAWIDPDWSAMDPDKLTGR